MWKTNLSYFVLLSVFLCVFLGNAQEKKSTPLEAVIHEIERIHNIQFNYESDLLNIPAVVLYDKTLSLAKQLETLSEQTQLIFSQVSTKIIAIYKPYTYCGYVKDLSSNDYLSGATIMGKGVHAITDANGYFKITLKSHNTILTIRHLGYASKKIIATNENKTQCLPILLEELAIQIDPVVLPAYIIKGINKLSSGDTELNFATFSLLPGLTDTDVLHSLQSLPAVQSTDDTVANINVRGGAHDQNLILWDGIKMYQTGHFFGLISSFHPQISKKVHFTKNGTDAAFSDGVSSTIHLKSNQKRSNHFKGNMSMNLISTDGFFEVPVGENVSFQLAFRKSSDFLRNGPTFKKYFDRITQQTEVARNTLDVVNLNKKFGFNDVALQGLYTPSKKDFFRWNFLWITNTLTFEEKAIQEVNTSSRTSQLSQNSLAGGIYYKRTWNSRWTTDFSIYETDYFLQGENVNVINKQRVLQENNVSETGIKTATTYSSKMGRKLVFGYEVKETGVTNVNDIDIPRYRKLQTDVIRAHALFGQFTYSSKNSRNFISAGIRTTYLDPLNVFVIEPRFRLMHKQNNKLRFSVMGEMKHQYTSQLINFQNDFLGIEKRRWQLANNADISIMKSKQISIGTTYDANDWLVDVSGYVKVVKGITAQSQEFTTKYEFEKAIGDYHVNGIDVLMRKRFNKLSSWIGYSGMHNTYFFPTLELEAFPSNFDITHALNCGVTYAVGGLKFSSGVNWRKGRPYSTPVDGNGVATQQIHFGQTNTDKLNNYFRADASVTYRKKLSEKIALEMGASWWNLFNYKNTINYYYRIANDTVVMRFDRYALGSTQNVVVKLFFN